MRLWWEAGAETAESIIARMRYRPYALPPVPQTRRPAPRSPRRRSWGFGSTRSWLSACRAASGAIPPDQPRASHDAHGAGAQNADHLAEKCWKCTDIGEVVCTLGAAVLGMAYCSHVNPLFRALTSAIGGSTCNDAERWESCRCPA